MKIKKRLKWNGKFVVEVAGDTELCAEISRKL